MKSKRNINKNNDNYAPGLPEEEINKLVKELSDPGLSPKPYSYDRTRELADKMRNIVEDLLTEYNHKVVEIIERERKTAFAEGAEVGAKKHAKN